MKKKFNKIVSPCISICQYDSENICLGCMRTKDERIKWKKDETTDAWTNSNPVSYTHLRALETV